MNVAENPLDQDLMTTSDKLSPSPDYADYSIGSIVFDRFEVLAAVASGSQGRVFKAKDLMLDKIVALKVLLGTTKNERDIVRFQHEARLASKMKHQGIATIYDFGIRDNTPFLSMEFVEGESLESILEREHTLPLLDLLEIFLQVCDAIQHAHEAGIIHRDIKPSNIIVLRKEDGTFRAKVLDFGVAKTLDVMQENKGRLTPTGNIIGSPFFMSPEQSKSQRSTIKSDNYSLGCVMCTAIVGEPPFVGENVMETLLCHANTIPPKLSTIVGDKVPVQLTELIDRLLSKNPDDRPDLKSAVIPTLVELLNACIADLHNPTASSGKHAGGTASGDEEVVEVKRSSKFWIGIAACGLVVVCGSIFAIQLYKSDVDSVTVGKSSQLDFLDGLKVGTATEAEALNQEAMERYIEKVRKGTKHDLSLGLDLKKGTLEKCTELPGLFRLDLNVANVYDSDINVITKIPNLRYLSLSRTQVKTLDGLDKATHLKGLELKNTNINNQSLKNVGKIKTLETLYLTNAKIDDEGIESIAGMPKLRDLDLTGVDITLKSAKVLKALPKLQILRLNGCNISDAALREILGSRSIVAVHIDDVAISGDQRLKLRMDFPMVKFPPDSSMGEHLQRLATEATEQNNHKEAYDRLKDLIRLLTRRYGEGSLLVANASANLAVYAARLGYQSEADQLIEKAVHVAETQKHQELMLTALNSKLAAMDYFQNASRQEILDTEFKAQKLELALLPKNSPIAAHRIVRIADRYLVARQFGKALAATENSEAFKANLSSNDISMFTESNMKYAECLRCAGKDKAACERYALAQQKLEALNKLTPLQAEQLLLVYLGVAAAHLTMQDYNKALLFNTKAVELSLKDHKFALLNRLTMYKQRADLLAKTGRKLEAEKVQDKVLKLEAAFESRNQTKDLKSKNANDQAGNDQHVNDKHAGDKHATD